MSISTVRLKATHRCLYVGPAKPDTTDVDTIDVDTTVRLKPDATESATRCRDRFR